MIFIGTFVAIIFLNYAKTEDLSRYKDPHFPPGRSSIVHLFEWKFRNIAFECEKFLAVHGYRGVQVSPVNENLILKDRPWYERYQPLTYKIVSRSGNEHDFVDMIKRCNNVGVRIYVDVVINHMSANSSRPVGTGGSTADPKSKTYVDAGYTSKDFHRTCAVENYQNATEVRNCELAGLHDLDHHKANVRCRVIEFINRLIDLGVAGIRVDAAKHMWPEDLMYIYSELNNLNTTYFPSGARPFIYQEVIDLGGEAVSSLEYTSFGRVTDFVIGTNLGAIFRNKKRLSVLKNWGTKWGLIDDGDSVVFIDNHDNQRGHGAGGEDILTYKVPKQYKMAIGFLLAWPLGVTRIMSSFEFNDPSQGPPHKPDFSLQDVEYNADLSCRNGWVCEHRWRQIYSMNEFRDVAEDTNITNWWDNGNNQIAFSRGNKGFIAFNGENYALNSKLQTGLRPGHYCDIISGQSKDDMCTGKLIIVESDGRANIYINNNDFDGFIAIHEKSLQSVSGSSTVSEFKLWPLLVALIPVVQLVVTKSLGYTFVL